MSESEFISFSGVEAPAANADAAAIVNAQVNAVILFAIVFSFDVCIARPPSLDEHKTHTAEGVPVFGTRAKTLKIKNMARKRRFAAACGQNRPQHFRMRKLQICKTAPNHARAPAQNAVARAQKKAPRNFRRAKKRGSRSAEIGKRLGEIRKPRGFAISPPASRRACGIRGSGR
ncbi:hypothetical protein P3B99_002125 [Opitutia bacterium KCR 482]